MAELPANFWLIHGLASVAGSALMWGLGLAVERAFRLSVAARGYWLAIWLMAVIPTVLALALQLVPSVNTEPIQAFLPLPAAMDLSGIDGGTAQAAAQPLASISWSTLLCLAYFTGLISLGARILIKTLKVRRIVRRALPIDAAAWSGTLMFQEVRRLEAEGIGLRMTRRSITPFAVSSPERTIILPEDSVTRFDDRALRLIIRHEAAHLAQRDPQRAAIMSCVGLIFWFNPFLRRVQARVQMAAELRCDSLALADDHAGRTVLARAYVETLKMNMAQDDHLSVTALAHHDLAGHKVRIKHMLHGDSGRSLGRHGRVALSVVALAAVVGTASVQFAAAAPLRGPNPSTPEGPVAQTGAPAGPMRMTPPLAVLRVTSPFEETNDFRSRPHRGTDFAARVGTSVGAVADGVVVAATDQYADGENYGTVVVLDHGHGWQSLYAHLDQTTVQVGQRVSAGDQIARSGRSGRVSGPHLHLEVLKDGQRVDPDSVLSIGS